MSVKVRFAPSPTGRLSLGNARTALFNWLFAKHMGGQFLFRLEDTDKERSKKEYEENIITSLKWLGLTWDNQIVPRQSERIDVYQSYLEKLLNEHHAYYCFCTLEELEAENQERIADGLLQIYSGRCAAIPKEAALERAKNERATIRFRMPARHVHINDEVRGEVSWNTELVGDFIIAKSLHEPLYNFAVVIDDFEFEVTHVIRGEDLLPSTPKQMMIQEALGFTHPHYAHLPLILGPDRKKLSKRYLATSVLEYRDQGYLLDAILNFLLLLGWHPKDDREVLSLAEVVNEFDLKRVQKGGAVYNPDKLDWLNTNYIRDLALPELKEQMAPFVPSEWFSNEELFLEALNLERDRMKKLSDFKVLGRFFFELPEYPTKLLPWKETPLLRTQKNLLAIRSVLENLFDNEFSREVLHARIMPVAESAPLGRGEFLWPLRVALSGLEHSPGPFEIAAALGKPETIRRVLVAAEKIGSET